MFCLFIFIFFFFFNDTATTEIYTTEDTLSLHDALPISGGALRAGRPPLRLRPLPRPGLRLLAGRARAVPRLAGPYPRRLGPHPVRWARAGRSARVQRLFPRRLGSVPAAADHRAGGADLSRREEAQPASDRQRGRIRRR